MDDGPSDQPYYHFERARLRALFWNRPDYAGVRRLWRSRIELTNSVQWRKFTAVPRAANKNGWIDP
jgi:hypothetical protein